VALYADGDSSNGPASDRPGIGSRISYTKFVIVSFIADDIGRTEWHGRWDRSRIL